MSEQNQQVPNQNEMPMIPPEHFVPEQPMVTAPAETEAQQGRVSAWLSRMNTRYNAWVDGKLEKNPDLERGRFNATVGIVGGLAVIAAYKFGPEYADHLVGAVQNAHTEAGDKALDVATFGLTTGMAFGLGMNRLDRRNARKHAQTR